MSNTGTSYDQDDQQTAMPDTSGAGTSVGRRDTMADPAGTAAEGEEDITSDIGDVSGTTRPADVGATDHTRAGAFDSGANAGTSSTDRTNPPAGQGAAPNSAP